jgi:aryl-phospho-beta-D-glucosidase BglC (GH1 family)
MDLGINLWGADWVDNGERLLPTTSQIDYFAAKGFTNVRLTFTWETIQSALNGPLDADFLSQMHDVVKYAASQGVDVILDVHSYGKYNDQLIGSQDVPVSAFADLWGKIASEFATDTNVRFGLMNEPQLNSTSDWLVAVNSAIAAIRSTGADQQVLVAGNGYTGTAGWYEGDNGKILAAPGAIVDPAQNYAFEHHLYLDDTSGQHDWVVSETIGVERLTAMTEWARANGLTFYLGEFGVADNPTALAALDKMMAYLQANDDVWKSASYWVAGGENTDYMYSVQPELKILDVPQMDVLEKYTGAAESVTMLADGTVRQDVYTQDGKTVTLSDILSKDGALLSRSIYDADGNLSSKGVIGADGSVTVTVYDAAGKSLPYTTTVYNADHERVQESVADATGAVTVKYYEPGAHDPYQESAYHADGSLDYITKNIDGQHIGETYQNGVLAKVEVYNSSWGLVSRDSFDASGHLTQRQVDNADGSHDISSFNVKTGMIQSSTEYSAAWKVVSDTSYDAGGLPTRQVSYEADGGRTIVSYAAGSDAISSSQQMTADGKLASLTTYSENGQTTNVYAPPGSSKLQSVVVVENGVVVSTAHYDAKGLISSIEHVQPDGARSIETYDSSHQAHPTSVTAYDADWKLLSVSYFDDAGQKTAVNVAGDHGLNTVTAYVAGTDIVSKVEVYIDWKLQTRTSYDDSGKITGIQKDHADGTYEVQNFTADHQDHPASTSLYDTAWNLVNVTYFDDAGQKTAVNVAGDHGLNTVTAYVAGTDIVSKVEVFNDWKLETRTSYDADGKVTSIQKDHADGTYEVQNFTADHQDHPASTSLYDTAWKLASITYFDDAGQKTAVNVAGDHGLNTVTSFVPGTEDVAKVEVFINWELQSRTTFDTHGADGSSAKSALTHGDFLVSDSSATPFNFDSFTANSDSASQHSDLHAADMAGHSSQDDEFFPTWSGDGTTDVPASDNHIFNSSHDQLVVAPHYDLM